MNSALRSIILVCVLIMAFGQLQAQSDSLPSAEGNVVVPDSILPVDDTMDFESPVTYFGKDSTIMDLDSNRIYLYGIDSYVKYGTLEVKAGYIAFSFDNYSAYASGLPDSTGAKVIGKPVFKDGDTEFSEDSLGYNFKTKKGISYGARTREGEAYLISGVSKKQENDWIHIKNGMFTTCDAEKPHYHFRLSRAIVVPDEKVVSGPLFMKVGKIPTPLALPFGFFPNKKESTHGLLLPGYGNGAELGYFLKELGYYIPIKPYLETKLLFDIYSRGSWAVQSVTNYKRRYKYSGSLRLSRLTTKQGFKELPTYFEQQTFNVNWTHNQDGKARPNERFSASVNMGSSQNFRNNLNSSQQDFLTSTFNSAVQWGKTFPGKPYALALSANHTQNTQTRQVQVTLPSATVNVSRINLFERLFPKSPIGISGVVSAENYLNANESEIRFDRVEQLLRGAQSGVRFNSTASTSWKLGPFLTINPNFSYTGVASFKYIGPSFDEDLGFEKLDTLTGMRFGGNWNGGVTANTRLFGTYIFKNSKSIKAIRHMVQPSFGFSYTPYSNFNQTGFYGEDGEVLTFSPFGAGRYSPSNSQESASLNIGINQNIEAKVRDKSSAKVAYKKVKILEGWNMRVSNNLLRDSLNWSNLNITAFTSISKNVSVNYNSTYSFYDRDTRGREINRSLLSTQGKLMRMEGTTLALSFRFAGGTGQGKEGDDEVAPAAEQQNLQSTMAQSVDFSVPWNVRLDYNISFNNQWSNNLQADSLLQAAHSATLAGDFKILNRWAITFLTNYDLESKKVSTSTIGLNWDLHCWVLSANYVPFGERKSYFVQLNIKSALLQDLKVQRRGNLGNSTLLY